MEKQKAVIQDNKQIEIDLVTYFWAVMAHWRKILIWTLIFVFVFGGFKAYRSYRAANDPEIQAAALAEQKSYQMQRDKLEAYIDALNRQYDNTMAFASNSALFAIDPYHVFVEEAVYYIDPSLDSLSSGSLHNDESVVSLVNAYGIAISRVDVASLLAVDEGRPASLEVGSLQDEDTELMNGSDPITSIANKSIPSFLTVNTRSESGIIEILAIGASEEQARTVMKAAEDEIAAVKPALSEQIHIHSVSQISCKSYQIVSRDLMQMQIDVQEQGKLLFESVENAKTSLEKLKIPAAVPTRSGAFRSAVKYAAFGFVIGGLFSAVLIAFRMIFTEQILSPDELRRHFKLSVLGVLATSEKANRLDRWIARRRGILPKRGELSAVELISANTKSLGAAYEHVLFAGSAKKERILSLCEKLSSDVAPMKLIPVGTLYSDPDSVKALGSEEAVVLVEEIGETSLIDVEREIARIEQSGKQLLGVILVADV